MKKFLAAHGFALACLFAASAAFYGEYWSGTKLFTGKDYLTAFSPLVIFQADCLNSLSLPLWNPFMNFGYPYVEHFQNSFFFPTHLIMGLIGSGIELVQRELLFWIVLGGFGIYLCSREFEVSLAGSVMAGVCFMFCGQMIALPHWHTLVYNAACFPYMLLGYHKSLKKETAYSPLSIFFTVLMILGGYLPSTVLGLYIFAAYALLDSLPSRRTAWCVRYLAVTVGVSLLIASPKLIPLYNGMSTAPRMSAAETKDPFNIVNLYSFFGLLIPVKFYFSLYVGLVPVVLLSYAIVKRRVSGLMLAVMFALTAWLLAVSDQGDTSLLRSASNVLPFMKQTRNEWLEWFYPSIFLILFAARQFDGFLSERSRNTILVALASAALLATTSFFSVFNTRIHLYAYLVQLALIIVIAVGAAMPIKLKAGFLALLAFADLYIVFQRINIDIPVARSNGLIRIMVTHQVGASRSYMDGELVHQTMPMIVLDDAIRPSVDDGKRNPVLLSGLDGNFVDSMNQKRFAGWWYNVQERMDFVRIKESPLLAGLHGQPLFSLLNDSGRELQGNARFDKLTCSSFEFSALVQEPGYFLLRQLYDDRWSAYVDGKPEALRRGDGSFMGVHVPPGIHKIRLVFTDKSFVASCVISALTLLIMAGAAVINRRRHRHFSGN